MPKTAARRSSAGPGSRRPSATTRCPPQTGREPGPTPGWERCPCSGRNWTKWRPDSPPANRQRAGRRKGKNLSLEEKLLADILAGKVRLRCHVHKIDDIATILRLTEEFPVKVSIEHAMDVHQPGIYEKLKKKEHPGSLRTAGCLCLQSRTEARSLAQRSGTSSPRKSPSV